MENDPSSNVVGPSCLVPIALQQQTSHHPEEINKEEEGQGPPPGATWGWCVVPRSLPNRQALDISYEHLSSFHFSNSPPNKCCYKAKNGLITSDTAGSCVQWCSQEFTRVGGWGLGALTPQNEGVKFCKFEWSQTLF